MPINCCPLFSSRRKAGGFSLLEVTLALGISGMLLAGIWQISSVSLQQREIISLAGQSTSVVGAAQNYINGQRAALLALPQLATIGSVARIKVTSADTGDTSDSIQEKGYLPRSFVNTNSYGQAYAVYVRREDAGTTGVVDVSDRLVGLVVTTGGSAIPDTVATKLVGRIGASGGFLYAADNPAAPTAATTARGLAGAWSIDLTSSGWSGIGSVAQAGRLAALVNVLPTGSSAQAGATQLNDLDDGVTDYTTLFNVYGGSGAGEANTVGGYNTAWGYQAQRNLTPTGINANNTSFGYQAMMGWPTIATGTDNVAFGAYALSNVGTMSRNVGIGVSSSWNMTTGNDRVTIGYSAGLSCLGSDVIAIGSYAGGHTTGSADCSGSIFIGKDTSHFGGDIGNTMVGAYNGYSNTASGTYNTSLGAYALNSVMSTSTKNVAVGYQAAQALTTASQTISLGYGTAAGSANGSLNINNRIYGNVVTGQLSIGSATLTSGISFDVGGRNDTVRITRGTTATRPACSGTVVGSIRYNTTTNLMEFCTASGWKTPVATAPTATPPTASPTVGYWVLSSTTHDANFGSLANANAWCLNDLQTNDWRGKADAVSRGILTSTTVQAFLTTSGPSGNPMPVTTYYFARSNSPSSGGASFTTNSYGQGPGDTTAWSGPTYFDGTYEYWLGSRGYSSAYFDLNGCCNGYCSDWRSNSSGDSTGSAISSNSGYMRYTGSSKTCNVGLYVICIVNPF